ncbi:MAG: ROK family protein, partial [Deltaproteobacteria bacterium]|nr:ROK family protein [Deltaproteobacteria bacterium]
MICGIDLGGTRVKAARVESGSVTEKNVFPTPRGATPAELLDALAGAARSIAPGAQAVGLAIPGEVDAGGRCIRLPNLPGFDGVPIGAELSTRLGVPVTVENDATAAAAAEAQLGHGREYPSFLLVTLGTGVGGGLVLDRRTRRGAHGFAGELGHVVVDARDVAALCGCGNRGCLEAYAGGLALLGAYRSAGGAGSEVREVTDSARRGERAGREALAQMIWALSAALTSVQNLLDLDAIVFAGGVAGSFDLLEPGLRT